MLHIFILIQIERFGWYIEISFRSRSFPFFWHLSFTIICSGHRNVDHIWNKIRPSMIAFYSSSKQWLSWTFACKRQHVMDHNCWERWSPWRSNRLRLRSFNFYDQTKKRNDIVINFFAWQRWPFTRSGRFWWVSTVWNVTVRDWRTF